MAKPTLDDRIRAGLKSHAVTERRMFGGICFMLNGNMMLGASPRGLMVRVGKDGNDAALARPFTRPMIHGGRHIDGYVFVADEGTARDEDLNDWIDLALRHVSRLPAKEAKEKTATKTKPKRRAKTRARA